MQAKNSFRCVATMIILREAMNVLYQLQSHKPKQINFKHLKIQK